jgi:hypothetical protein
MSRFRLRGATGFRSGWLALRVDTVLAEYGAEPLDLVGELLASLGQSGQRRVPGGPLLLPRGLIMAIRGEGNVTGAVRRRFRCPGHTGSPGCRRQ